MTLSPELAAKLARRDALVAEHRLRPQVTVEVPWPAHWPGGELGAFVHRLWDALAPTEALGRWVTIGTNRRGADDARLTADALGITCVSGDYGAVQGDALITQYTLVHHAWMLSTYEISDCTMSALRVEVHAAPEQLETLAATVHQLLAAEPAADRGSDQGLLRDRQRRRRGTRCGHGRGGGGGGAGRSDRRPGS